MASTQGLPRRLWAMTGSAAWARRTSAKCGASRRCWIQRASPVRTQLVCSSGAEAASHRKSRAASIAVRPHALKTHVTPPLSSCGESRLASTDPNSWPQVTTAMRKARSCAGTQKFTSACCVGIRSPSPKPTPTRHRYRGVKPAKANIGVNTSKNVQVVAARSKVAFPPHFWASTPPKICVDKYPTKKAERMLPLLLCGIPGKSC
mmetsp:Transcript_11789/g.32274  ORF Transcript_11789/g.32274 Transcript_11789/m.32274 type:complete len:205 (-) Transcript_11789:184-798(-)